MEGTENRRAGLRCRKKDETKRRTDAESVSTHHKVALNSSQRDDAIGLRPLDVIM